MSKAGAEIIAALEDAAAGNFARVYINGQVWVRQDEAQDVLTSQHVKDLALMAKMAEALKPFADAADRAERMLCKHNTDEILIKLGHLRRARTALAPANGEPS